MAHSALHKLNFPAINARLRGEGAATQIWDSLRGVYLQLTPEEWVRQHALHFLLEMLQAPKHQAIQEFPVRLNGQNQRADIVIVDSECRPRILVECKAPEVKIDKKVLDQAVRYNSQVGAEFIVLTNGITHRAFRRGENLGEYLTLRSFEELKI